MPDGGGDLLGNLQVTQSERRALLPQSSEFIDAMFREFGGLASVSASENGHKFEWHNTPQVNQRAERSTEEK